MAAKHESVTFEPKTGVTSATVALPSGASLIFGEGHRESYTTSDPEDIRTLAAHDGLKVAEKPPAKPPAKDGEK